MNNFMPHMTEGNMLCNLDTFQFTFTNVMGEFVDLLASNKDQIQPIRTAWRIYTVDMMHHHTTMYINRKGVRYQMICDAGYKLYKIGGDSKEFKIWARPITPHHVTYCIDNQKPMSEAVKNVKMTKKSFRDWNRGKRPDYYGMYK